MVLENLKKYQVHPRILELKIALFYTRLRREYEYNTVINIFQGLSQAFSCNWTAIKGIVDNMPSITRMKKYNWLRYRQEMLFLGFIEGKNKNEIAKDLGIKPSNLYASKYPYDAEEFATEEWLRELSNSVTLCGVPQYQKETYRFLLGLETLKGVI